MGSLRFLDATQAARLQLDWPDVYFTPEYGRAAEWVEDGVWELAIWEPGPILYPYLRRPIPSTPGECDIVSPYGYAGTWAPPEVPQSEWLAFRRSLRGALRDQGVVAEFQRISSLVAGHAVLLAADPDLHGWHHNDTVALELQRGYEHCWNTAEGRSRTKTRKARRLGYTWASRPAKVDDLEPGGDFRRLYDETMRRVSASSYYLFRTEHYLALLEGLGAELWIAEVRTPAGAVCAAGLFITRRPLLHLHLTGQEVAAMRDGAGNLLYDGLIRWGCDEGYLRLHIGGGLKPNDNLYYFKRGFGGDPVPMWLARSVVAPDRYRDLVDQQARVRGCTSVALEQTGYFPAYRAQVATEA